MIGKFTETITRILHEDEFGKPSPSSPGKDGGQEVEAVGEQWRAIEDGSPKTSWYPVGYGDEAGWKAIAKRHPEKYQIVTRPVFAAPSPQSTVDASRLIERGQAFANQVRCITHLLHGQAYSTTVSELNAFDAALAKSPSSDRAASEVVERLKELADYLDIHHFASDRHKAADMVSRARSAIAEAKGSGQ